MTDYTKAVYPTYFDTKINTVAVTQFIAFLNTRYKKNKDVLDFLMQDGKTKKLVQYRFMSVDELAQLTNPVTNAPLGLALADELAVLITEFIAARYQDQLYKRFILSLTDAEKAEWADLIKTV